MSSNVIFSLLQNILLHQYAIYGQVTYLFIVNIPFGTSSMTNTNLSISDLGVVERDNVYLSISFCAVTSLSGNCLFQHKTTPERECPVTRPISFLNNLEIAHLCEPCYICPCHNLNSVIYHCESVSCNGYH